MLSLLFCTVNLLPLLQGFRVTLFSFYCYFIVTVVAVIAAIDLLLLLFPTGIASAVFVVNTDIYRFSTAILVFDCGYCCCDGIVVFLLLLLLMLFMFTLV